MSQCDPADLLCSSRREELSLDKQRRLRQSLQYSLEVRLMSQILPELEEQSRARPEDDLLLARINASAVASLGPRVAPPPPRRARTGRRTVLLLLAATLLFVAGLAGAWLAEGRLHPAPAHATPRAA